VAHRSKGAEYEQSCRGTVVTDTAKALSLVGPINTAYDAAQKADGDALRYALECGKHLKNAKEIVKAEKGKWKTWRETNIPKVSEDTERVYRRLADAKEIKEDFFSKCKSIRGAPIQWSSSIL